MRRVGPLERLVVVARALACSTSWLSVQALADAPAGPPTLHPVRSGVDTEALLRSTVAVEGVSFGSGVVLGREGWVLTAAHVAGRAGRGCFVLLSDGTRLVGITMAVNSRHDFAIVKVHGVAELCSAAPVDSTGIVAGEEMIAVGYSGGYRPGRPAAVRHCRRTPWTSGMPTSPASIFTDASLNPGDSGGPLFDRAGRLMGIHVQALSTPDRALAMHVSLDVIRPVLAELRRRAGPSPDSNPSSVGATEQ